MVVLRVYDPDATIVIECFADNAMGNISLLRELLLFLKYEKKWWLLPVLILLVLMGVLIVFSESSALAPFLYPLF